MEPRAGCELVDFFMGAFSMNDTEVLNWLEEHLDDLSVMRDVIPERSRVELSFCAERSGCQVDISAATIRGAVARAIKVDRSKDE